MVVLLKITVILVTIFAGRGVTQSTQSLTRRTNSSSLFTSSPPSSRFCNSKTTVEFLTPCKLCSLDLPTYQRCPPGSEFKSNQACTMPVQGSDIDVNEEEYYDDTTATTGSGYVPNTPFSCQSICTKEEEVPDCCSGYWGTECQDCPIGFNSDSCSSHGVCNDGRSGDGSCDCEGNFTGMACEMCESGLYGENCTEICHCVHGVCDEGTLGSGACRCFKGFTGDQCDEEIVSCDTLVCWNNSACQVVKGQALCVCDPGYQPNFVGGSNVCEGVDRCKLSSPCGKNADCVVIGPDMYECVCKVNYEGDGYMCRPVNPCLKDNGGCDNVTMACVNIAPNVSGCDCLAGYEKSVIGVGCTLIDLCHRARCHPQATCTTTAPNQIRCTCMEGYAGDGIECYGNILQRLRDLNENHRTQKGQLSMALSVLENVYRQPLEDRGPFTIFVPNNRGFRKARRDFSYSDMLTQKSRSQQVIRQHMLIGKLTLQDLQNFTQFYTLDGSIAELQVRLSKNVFKYRVRGYTPKAKVLIRDLPASNGMIHIVNELLVNEPVIAGNPSQSAIELIRVEGRFNRMQTLISSLGLEPFFIKDNITVFAPENGGLDELPEGTLDYLMTEEDGKNKLRTILENHVFPGKIPVTDLVRLQRIRSFSKYATTISVTNMGQIQLNGEVNISQANIPCKNAVYYHIDGPLIPPELAQILPNRCDIPKNTTIKASCTACDMTQCPLNTDVFTGEVSEGCFYWMDSATRMPGCQAICTRTHSFARCCKGFYGPSCTPCPGGYKNPCNGRGDCNDEIFGTGFCLCRENFRGKTCELCLRRNFFGPNCTQECSCLHGECDGGPLGSGKCKKGSCYPGYRGENCHQEVKRCSGAVLVCHTHSECIQDASGVSRCECKKGYEGDGQQCQEIDPCQKPDRGGCHAEASCAKIGPGANRCQCDEGWFGDGFTCNPETPCAGDADCHSNASCHNLEPGKYSCLCNKGFEGNGTFCSPVDGCITDNGGCHRLASCTSTGPGTVNCTCPEHYVGDGITCFTTIAGHIMGHENLTVLASLLKTLDPADNILDDIGESLTMFAPVDTALRNFLAVESADGYFNETDNLMTFFSFHTVPNSYKLADMLAMGGVSGFDHFKTLFDGYAITICVKNKEDKTVLVFSNQTSSSRVVVWDIAGLNGYLHIIDGVLEPFLPDSDVMFLTEFFAMNSQYSNFGSSLDTKGLISELHQMDQYTLFVPDNSVFVPDAINHTITTDYLKYYIVPKIILTPSLIDGETAATLLGSTHQLLFKIQDGKMYVNNAEIVRSNLMLMEGVVHVISSLLTPVLNYCNESIQKVVFGLCGPCTSPSDLKCDIGFQPSDSIYIQRNRCKYSQFDASGLEHKFLGCSRLCQQSVMGSLVIKYLFKAIFMEQGAVAQ